MKNKILKSPVMPGLITLIILLLLLFTQQIAPFGSKSLATMDANIQYRDFFAYLKDILGGKGAFPYSLGMTLGGSTISLLAYYLMSPFNALIVFFSKSQINTFFDVLVVLKLSLASSTMALFLKKRFNSLASIYVIAFSLSYGLMQYSGGQSSNVMWLDGVYLLPLMLLGIFRLIQSESWLFLAIFTGCSLTFNWYTGIINCFFTVFWLVLEYCLANNRDYLVVIWNYIKGMVTGILLASFIFITNFYALVHGSRRDFFFNGWGLVANPLNLIARLSIFSVSDATHISFYCGSLVLVGAVGFFFSKSINIRAKITVGMATFWIVLCYYWQPLYSLFSMFKSVESYWSRYGYLGSFFLIFVASFFFASFHFSKANVRVIGYSFLTLIFLIVVGSWRQHLINHAVLTAGILFIVCAVLVFIIRKPNFYMMGSSIICLLTIGELMVNINYQWKATGMNSNETTAYKRYTQAEIKQLSQVKKDDDGEYRILQTINRGKPKNQLMANYNEPLAYNFWSLTGYTSNQDPEQLKLLEKLGYRSEVGRLTIVNNPILPTDSLLGVKYLLTGGEDTDIRGLQEVKTTKVGKRRVYKNPYALPLAFTSSNKVTLTKDNPFVFQNKIYQELAGSSNNIYRPIKFTQKVKKNSVSYRLTISKSKNPIYGNILWQQSEPAKLYVNNQYKTDYTKWLSPSVFNVTPQNKVNNQVELRYISNLSQLKAQFYQLDLMALREVTNQIKQNSDVSQSSIQNGKMSFTVNAPKDENLYLTIPYDNAWQIKDNGKRIKARTWLGHLMLIKLSKGKHELNFICNNRHFAFYYWILLSIICFFQETRKE